MNKVKSTLKSKLKSLFNFGVSQGKEHVVDIGNTLINGFIYKIIFMVTIVVFIFGAGCVGTNYVVSLF